MRKKEPVNAVAWATANNIKILETYGFGDGVIGEKDGKHMILNGRYINGVPCVEQYNTKYAVVNNYDEAERIMDRKPDIVHKIQ